MVKKKIAKRYAKSPPRKKEEKVKVKVRKKAEIRVKAELPSSCSRCKSQKIEVISAARGVAEFLEPSHKPTANSRTHISNSRACKICGLRWQVAA